MGKTASKPSNNTSISSNKVNDNLSNINNINNYIPSTGSVTNSKLSWEWQENDGSWKPYDNTIIHILNNLQINNTYTYTFYGNNQKYKITKTGSNCGYQTNMYTKVQRNIRQNAQISTTVSQINDDIDINFKDVSAIFNNDNNNDDKDIKILSKLYEYVYLINKNDFNKDEISDIINKMIKFIPDKHWKEVEKLKNKLKNDQHNDQKDDYNQCQVCFCDFNDDDCKLIQMKEYCNHSIICKLCLIEHLKIKIKSSDITPWLLCPYPNCRAPISNKLIFKYLDIKYLYKFSKLFIFKHLLRNSNWIQCKTKNCKYGFVIIDKDKTYKLQCKSCNKWDNCVSHNSFKHDKSVNNMIKNGIIRLCPSCSLPTMKDKGMCNIMSCGKCGIFWNWRTKETGTSSAQLKQKARNNGNLWEPGELSYQQNLEKTNLQKFKKLLAKNGIKYDPNYRRGQ